MWLWNNSRQQVIQSSFKCGQHFELSSAAGQHVVGWSCFSLSALWKKLASNLAAWPLFISRVLYRWRACEATAYLQRQAKSLYTHLLSLYSWPIMCLLIHFGWKNDLTVISTCASGFHWYFRVDWKMAVRKAWTDPSDDTMEQMICINQVSQALAAVQPSSGHTLCICIS